MDNAPRVAQSRLGIVMPAVARGDQAIVAGVDDIGSPKDRDLIELLWLVEAKGEDAQEIELALIGLGRVDAIAGERDAARLIVFALRENELMREKISERE